MKGSVDENSALVMSLWHCIFAWFFADSTNRKANTDLEENMASIYSYMSSLRSIITNHVDHNHPQKHIQEMSDTFQRTAFSGQRIPHDVWVGELHSLMEELVSIHDVLKDYQLRSLMKADDNLHSLELSLQHINNEPTFVVCLLTLWYWLAVWCSPSRHHRTASSNLQHFTKKFVLKIEANDSKLATCLVSPSREHEKVLEELLGNLMDMLKSDLQHWIDALDNFTYKMTHAGLVHGQVKQVLTLTRDRQMNSTQLTVPENKIVSSAPPRKVLRKKDVLKKQMHDSLISKDLNDIVDKIADVIKRTINVAEDFKDIVFHDIPEVVEEFGGEITVFAKEVVHDIKVVHNGLEKLVHAMGEGIHHFAKGIGSVVHKIGSFFKHIF